MNTSSYLYYKHLLWHCYIVIVNKQTHGSQRRKMKWQDSELIYFSVRLCKLDEEMCTVSGSGWAKSAFHNVLRRERYRRYHWWYLWVTPKPILFHIPSPTSYSHSFKWRKSFLFFLKKSLIKTVLSHVSICCLHYFLHW